MREADPVAAEALAREAAIPPIIARLLAARGVQNAEEAARFLRPGLDDLHDPYLMLGMATAVERIQRAVAVREPILIYGPSRYRTGSPARSQTPN